MAVDQMSKDKVLKVMKRVGLSESVPDAARELPDPVDFRRDHALLDKYGLKRDNLVDRMGGSP